MAGAWQGGRTEGHPYVALGTETGRSGEYFIVSKASASQRGKIPQIFVKGPRPPLIGRDITGSISDDIQISIKPAR